MNKNLNEEIITHEDQSDIFDFLKKPNIFCQGCRYIVDSKCTNMASTYYKEDVRNEEVVTKVCDDKFSEVDMENMNISDEETGSLI